MWNRYVGLRRSVVRTRTCFLKGGGWPRLGHPTIDPAAYLGITFAEFAGQVTALDGEDSRMRFEASGAGQSPSEILVRLVAGWKESPWCVGRCFDRRAEGHNQYPVGCASRCSPDRYHLL